MLAGPAIKAGDGRTFVRGGQVAAFDAGIAERTVLIEFDNFKQAIAAARGRRAPGGAHCPCRRVEHDFPIGASTYRLRVLATFEHRSQQRRGAVRDNLMETAHQLSWGLRLWACPALRETPDGVAREANLLSMDLKAVTVGVPVRDLAAATQWYQSAFSLGEPDLVPMDGLVEFDPGPFWLQLTYQPELAGHDGISLNISIGSAAVERERFAALGLDVTDLQRVEEVVEFFELTDLDGNKIGFVTELH